MRKGPQRPMQLCKYFGPDGIRALDSMTFRFTPPKNLNDPFEARTPVVLETPPDGLSFGVSKHGRKGVLSPPQLDVLNALNETYGFTCFSESPDNLLMWAHYGQSHTGFSIHLNTAHPAFGALGTLVPVTYSRDRPKLDFPARDAALLRIFSIKSPEWSYEKEWRLITRLDTCQEVGPLFLKSIDSGLIARVMLGANASAELATHIEAWQRKHPAVEVLRYRLDSFKFRLYQDKELHHEPDMVVSEHDPKSCVVVTSNPGQFSFAILDLSPDGVVIRDHTSRIARKDKRPKDG